VIGIRVDTSAARSRREAALAPAAAWLAYMGGLLAGGDLADVESLAFACAIGAMFVLVGFAAAWRCRALPARDIVRFSQLVLLSLLTGTALGILNLAANWGIAEADPTLRTLLAQRMAAIGWLDAVVAAPLVEEVGVRLFLMSAIGWVMSRFTTRARLVFAIALVASSFFFATLHLARPLPSDETVANYYQAVLLAKYTLAGVPLGWVFWRWGLPYSIVCHAAANAAHIAFQGLVF
jgi:membrane protease YdiL (CAAX protease family)